MTVHFLEDFPASTAQFDFDLIARALVPLLEQPTEGALVLGIHGPWGSGKTTLLQSVRQALGQGQGTAMPVFVDFNAWKYHEREALWRALILRVLAELSDLTEEGTPETADLDELKRSLYRAFVVQEKGPWKVNWQSLITEVITIGLSVIHLDFVGKALAGSFSWVTKLFPKKKDGDGLDPKSLEQLGSLLERTTTQRQVDQVQSIEQFVDKFRDVVGKLQQDRRVYVLIDDLDRCLPEDALDIFESIKLFLDAPRCVFLVALDRDVIRKGLRLRYGSQADSDLLIDPDEYIEKTISISYDLPRLSSTDVRSIIDEFTLPVTLSDAHKEIVITGLGTNPRRIKRFMNTLSFQLRLAALAHEHQRSVPAGLLGGGDPTRLSHYLKLLLISYRFSGVFALATEDEDIFLRLQGIANATSTARQQRQTRLATEPFAARALENEEEFWALLRSDPQFQSGGLGDLLRWFRNEGGVGG
jgi:KAP family P-loop domain